jgi:hypothetical protein
LVGGTLPFAQGIWILEALEEEAAYSIK